MVWLSYEFSQAELMRSNSYISSFIKLHIKTRSPVHSAGSSMRLINGYQVGQENYGCFPLYQTDQSDTSGITRGKMEPRFLSNRAKWGNEPVCQKGKAYFGRTSHTDQIGPPPEGVPNIPVRLTEPDRSN